MSLVATDMSDSNLNLKTSNAWNQIDFTWNAVNLANIPLIFEHSKHVQQEKHERYKTPRVRSITGDVIYQLSQKMYQMQ